MASRKVRSISVKQWYSAAISKIRTSLKPPSQEEVQCHDVVIFYNLVFDIGKPVNPTQAARELLKKDFACVSANHITDTVEIAPRFKQLLDVYEKAPIISYVQQKKWKALLLWVLHHPLHILFILNNIKIKIKRGGKQAQASTPPQKNTVPDLKDTLKLIDQSMVDFQKFEGLQLYSDAISNFV